MAEFLINAIYRATEGEGVFIGTPQVFVRFQGCAIGCLNCDSKDTWDFQAPDSKVTSLKEVLADVYRETFEHKIKRVSITGGDPLHPKHVPAVLQLATELKKMGFYINIEAAGTRIVPEIFALVDFISMDFKTPSTGVRTNPDVIEKLIQNYPGKFQIKSVVETRHDFDTTFDIYTQVSSKMNCSGFTWCLTPSYNLLETFPMARFIDVINWNQEVGGPFRVIGQQHKWIFGPDKKKV